MKRNEHLFQFTGAQISAAAHDCLEYHRSRIAHWKSEQESVIAEAKKSGVKVQEVQVTGGKQVRMYVDNTIENRLSLIGGKINQHQASADRFQIEADAYATQHTRTYELHPDDIVYFRLAGGPREE
jgi:hypothetical protein